MQTLPDTAHMRSALKSLRGVRFSQTLQPIHRNRRLRYPSLEVLATPAAAPAVTQHTMATSSTNAELAAEVEALRKQLASVEVGRCAHLRRRPPLRAQAASVPHSIDCWHCAQATLKQKEAQLSTVFPYSRSYGRTSINTILGAPDGGKSLVRYSQQIAGSLAGAAAARQCAQTPAIQIDSAARRRSARQVVRRRRGAVVSAGIGW